jgi:hypothetical protein
MRTIPLFSIGEVAEFIVQAENSEFDIASVHH